MAMRGMSKAIIQAVVNNGEWREGKEPLSYEIEYKGIIVVLYEQKVQYNVSSCKLNREKTVEAEEMSKRHNMDFLKAVHKIVKGIDFKKEFADIE